jgi:hypothetical protein
MNFSNNYIHYKITNAVFYQLENILNNISTGIYDPVNNASLKMYPNPSSDVLYIELNHFEKPDITIHNALDQIVVYSIKQEKDKVLINTSLLESGVYYLQLKSNKTVYTGKFIKN